MAKKNTRSNIKNNSKSNAKSNNRTKKNNIVSGLDKIEMMENGGEVIAIEQGQSYNDAVTLIRKTNNYDMFKNILGNRELRGNNYNRLIQSMEKKQLVIPILCNEDMEIIDGQHRFEVCRELNLPLYYYVVDGYGIDEVKRANLVGCNWMIDDYLKLNMEVGKEPYIEFKRIRDDYNISSSQLLEIFANKVIDFLDKLNDFDIFKEFNSYSFTKAFLKLFSLNEYDHKTMKKRLAKQSHKLNKRASYRDYLELLVSIYNFGVTKVRFGYDTKQDRFYII
jgi:hypothetical protein